MVGQAIKIARWLLLPISASGVVLLLLGRVDPGTFFQVNASTPQVSPSVTPPATEGERVYRSYEQWVALLGQEAQAIARQRPARLSILAGDSISLWFPPELLPAGVTWLNQGISGETTYGLWMRLNLLDQTQPEIIFVMIGINDLARDVRRVTIIENQRGIVRQLKAAHPKARIVIQSILPHGGSRLVAQPQTSETPPWVKRFKQLSNSEIRRLNDRLQLMAKEEAVEFLDLFPHFLDEKGDLQPKLTTDGLHLSRAGYEVWRSRLYAFDPQLFQPLTSSQSQK